MASGVITRGPECVLFLFFMVFICFDTAKGKLGAQVSIIGAFFKFSFFLFCYKKRLQFLRSLKRGDMFLFLLEWGVGLTSLVEIVFNIWKSFGNGISFNMVQFYEGLTYYNYFCLSNMYFFISIIL